MKAEDAEKLRELTDGLCIECERLATAENDLIDAERKVEFERNRVANMNNRIDALRKDIDAIVARPTKEVEFARY